MRRVLTFLALAAAACSSDGGDDAPIDLTQLGAACAAGDRCPAGLTCLTYFGFGGNELQSCEIACGEDPAACPTGSTCVTISDGPGPVCRAD